MQRIFFVGGSAVAKFPTINGVVSRVGRIVRKLDIEIAGTIMYGKGGLTINYWRMMDHNLVTHVTGTAIRSSDSKAHLIGAWLTVGV